MVAFSFKPEFAPLRDFIVERAELVLRLPRRQLTKFAFSFQKCGVLDDCKDGGYDSGSDGEELFRSLGVVPSMPSPNGGGGIDPLFSRLAGATIIRIGAPDRGTFDGGGLVIDYQTPGSFECHRAVLAFNENGMWLLYDSLTAPAHSGLSSTATLRRMIGRSPTPVGDAVFRAAQVRTSRSPPPRPS